MLRFENVGMRYGSGPEVLRDVTFALESGSFTFLTGASGAGKSTLLRLMFLANPPTRGLITLFGHDLATATRSAFPALRRRIGVVFQDFRLLGHLSAFDNVALPLRLAGRKPADYRYDVEELLNWVGLGDRLH
jgi:cell division transport system ATP-binding protein